MSNATLQCCPNCESELDVAQGAQVCPGCGLQIDEHTRVWRSSESWSRLALLYAGLGLVVGVLVSVVYRVQRDEVPNPALALLFAVLTPAIGLAARRVLGGRITGRFVAITPAGLVIGTRPQPRLVPWHDFERVADHRGMLRVQRRSSPIPIALDDIFADVQARNAFRAALHAAATRYVDRASASLQIDPTPE